MEHKMKFFYPKVKGVDVENRRITVCITKNEIDRHGERIEIQAVADALEGYAVNPVVLGDHQHRLSTGESSVIGHTIPESFRVMEDEVEVDIEFSITKNAETYWINFRDGHQKAVSIGFIDLEWRTEDVDGRKVYVTTKMELLEVSCVAVGANRGALVKVAGMFDRFAEKDMPESVEKFLNDKFDELKSLCEEGFEDIKSLFETDSRRLADLWLGKDVDSASDAGNSLSEQFNRIKNAVNPGG